MCELDAPGALFEAIENQMHRAVVDCKGSRRIEKAIAHCTVGKLSDVKRQVSGRVNGQCVSNWILRHLQLVVHHVRSVSYRHWTRRIPRSLAAGQDRGQAVSQSLQIRRAAAISSVSSRRTLRIRYSHTFLPHQSHTFASVSASKSQFLLLRAPKAFARLFAFSSLFYPPTLSFSYLCSLQAARLLLLLATPYLFADSLLYKPKNSRSIFCDQKTPPFSTLFFTDGGTANLSPRSPFFST